MSEATDEREPTNEASSQGEPEIAVGDDRAVDAPTTHEPSPI